MKKWFLLIIVAFFVSACAGHPWRSSRNWDPWWRSDLEVSFGNSYRQALANETLNPDASKNLSPVVGMDGKSAEEILKVYHKSYQKEQPAPTYIFNVGAGAGIK